MCLEKKNQLRESYETYEKRRIAQIVKEIPPERRAQLAEDIKFRANVMGYTSKNALEATLRHLKGES